MSESVLATDRVGSILTKDVVTVDPSDTLMTALTKMLGENVGSLVVAEGRKPVGIVTERDITRLCAKTGDLRCFEQKVKTVMSTPLMTVSPDTLILEALEIMSGNSIRRLPVVKNNELYGIITESDIVVWVLRETYKPNIPAHLKPLVEKIERLQKL